MKRKRIEPYLHALTAALFHGRYAISYAISWRRYLSQTFVKKQLKVYNVQSAVEARNLMNWYLDHGKRFEFNQMKRELCLLSEKERQLYIDTLTDEKAKSQMTIVNTYMNRFPVYSIAAYDYAYCIYISILAEKTGYILLEEALEIEKKAVERLQEAYSSWQDYLAAYAAGVQFANENQQKVSEFMNRFGPTMIRLLASRHSPYWKMKWDSFGK